MMQRILLFLTFMSMSGYAQMSDTEDVHPADVIEPKFNGAGLDAFQQFVYDHLDYAKIKPGKVVTSFTISNSGELTNIRIVEFKEVEAAAEIIRVLKISPKWESAKRGGKPYSVTIKLPFNFCD